MMSEKRLSVLRNLLNNRFLQVVMISLMIVSAAGPLMRVARSKAQDPQPKDATRLSLLVEQGFVFPSQLLAEVTKGGVSRIPRSGQSIQPILDESINLPEQLRRVASFDVTFSISGNARFETAQGLIAVTSTQNGVIHTPPIVAGASFGESFIRVVVDGQTVIENLRFVTLETGGIENLKKYIEADDPGLIAIGDHYAVLDESKMRVTDQTVTIRGDAPSQKDPAMRYELQDQVAPKIDQQNVVAGICVRVPWGPGWVNWHWSSSNPWSNGGYAYKPESLNVVYRADDLAGDAIDAIYNRYWGCYTALKVPDSCTIDWNQNGSWSSCCNAAAWAAGHRPAWVDTRQHGFPNCPPN